jgi:transposase
VPTHPKFPAWVIELVRAGKPQKQTSYELDIHPVTLPKWVKQDGIDRGKMPGTTATESAELRAAHRRIFVLETDW